MLLGTNQVDVAEAAFTAGGVNYPPGSWIVQAPREAVEEVARQTGLSFAAVASAPEVRRHLVDLPRLAVLHNWIDTQDAGWVRYTLDRAKVPYTLINDDDLKRGNLAERFDVVLYPRTQGGLSDLVHGIDPKYGPLAYTKTPEFPSQGIPDGSEDITGGMGFEGLLNLDKFVRGGGVLIALGSGGTLPVDGGIVRGVSSARLGVSTPGSEVRVKVVRPEHPLVYGYEELTQVFRGNGPVFDVPKAERARVVLQFGTKKPDGEEDEEGKEAGPGLRDRGGGPRRSGGRSGRRSRKRRRRTTASCSRGSAPREGGARRQAGDPRRPHRQGAGDPLWLRPAPPLPQPRRLPVRLQRPAELERPAAVSDPAEAVDPTTPQEPPQAPMRRPRSRAGAASVFAGIVLSRMMGFVREGAFARYFGVGPHQDALTAAIRVPNVLQNLLGEGALSASFIPIYSGLLEEGRDEEAGRFAGAIFGLMAAAAAAFALLGILLARPIVILLAPGFLRDAAAVAAGQMTVDRFALAVTGVRILFPMTGLLVLSVWALAILNSNRRFFLPYFAPVLWNSAIVAALLIAGHQLAGTQRRRRADPALQGGLLGRSRGRPAAVRGSAPRWCWASCAASGRRSRSACRGCGRRWRRGGRRWPAAGWCSSPATSTSSSPPCWPPAPPRRTASRRCSICCRSASSASRWRPRSCRRCRACAARGWPRRCSPASGARCATSPSSTSPR